MTPFETKTDSMWREKVCTDKTVACKSDVIFVCVFRCWRQGVTWRSLSDLKAPSPPPNDINSTNFIPNHPVRNIEMVIASHGTSLTQKQRLVSENENVLSKQKAQKKLIPEGWQHEAPTPRKNCTAEEWSCANTQKKKTNNWSLWVTDV